MTWREKWRIKDVLKAKKKNGFQVTVTNFYHVKTFFTLLSQEILQDLFIFILIELQENTKTWRLCLIFLPLPLPFSARLEQENLIHFVKTSTAFNPTLGT